MYLLGLVRFGAAANILKLASRTLSVEKSSMTLGLPAGNSFASRGYGKDVIIIVGVPPPTTTEYSLGVERFSSPCSCGIPSSSSLPLPNASTKSSFSPSQSKPGRLQISYAFVGRGSLMNGKGLTVDTGDELGTLFGEGLVGEGVTVGFAADASVGFFAIVLPVGFGGCVLEEGFAGFGFSLASNET